MNVTRNVATISLLDRYLPGSVTFYISLTKIANQNEKMRFRVSSLDNPSVYVVTKAVTAINIVSKVKIGTQPAAARGSRVLAADTVERGIDSLQQPVVVVRDAFGAPIEGVTVEPLMTSCGSSNSFNDTAVLEYSRGFTDERGIYIFVDLHVLAARSGTYCMRFGAFGLLSNFSDPFEVYDTSDPDLGSFENLELLLGLSLLGALPMMIFNSRRIQARWLVVGSFFLALLVLVGNVTFLGIVITSPGISSSDPLVLVQLSITLLIVVCTMAFLVLTAWSACRGKKDYHDNLTEMFKDHVRLLFRPVTDPKLLKAAMKKEARKAKQVLAASERKRWAEEEPNSWLKRSLRLLWVEAVDVLIMARDDYLLDITYFDYRKHLRTNFRYSTRFLIVIGVALLSVLVAAMACVIVILAVDNGLAQAKIKLATLEVIVLCFLVSSPSCLQKVETLRVSAGGMLFGGASIVLSQLQVFNATGVAGLLAQALDFAAPLLDGDAINSTDAQRYLSSTVIEMMISRLTITGLLAASIAVCYALLVVFSLFFVYRSHIFAARDG